MAALAIRDLDDAWKLELRLRAASQDRSMDEEARQIPRAALSEPAPPQGTLVARVRARFEGLGDVRLEIEPRARGPATATPAGGAGRPVRRGFRGSRAAVRCGLRFARVDPRA